MRLDKSKYQSLALLCFLTIALACVDDHKQHSKSDEMDALEMPKPKEPVVKRVIFADHRNWPEQECVDMIRIYNEMGQKTIEYDYESCKNLRRKEMYIYGDGRVKYSRIETSIENVTYKWYYDDNGLIKEKKASRVTKNFPYRQLFTYNDDDKLIEIISLMHDGTSASGTSRKVFEYLEDKRIRTISYSGKTNDVEGRRINHVYNNNNQEIQWLVYQDSQSSHPDTTFIVYEYY